MRLITAQLPHVALNAHQSRDANARVRSRARTFSRCRATDTRARHRMAPIECGRAHFRVPAAAGGCAAERMDAIHRRHRSRSRHSRLAATERTLLYRTPDSQSRAQGVMRPLEESELEQVLTKLFQFVGKNIENILQRTDAPHSLRLHKKRVYYVRDDVMKRAVSIGRDQLVSLGLCIGKFTHSDKFKLMVGALDLLAAHAKYKVRARGKECACIAHAR